MKKFVSVLSLGLLLAGGAVMMASAGNEYSAHLTSNQGGIAPRIGHCLTVDRDEAWGGTTFLRNSCAMDLDVRYCFGTQNGGCHTRIGSTSVPRRDSRTIPYERNDGYDRLAFIYYACDASHPACFDTLNGYARNLEARSPRI
jgi:hypothetical protein